MNYIKGLKGISSKQLRLEYYKLKLKNKVLWTRNVFISSVGAISLDVVK